MNNETNQSKIPLEMFALITKLLKSRREDFSDRITSEIKKIILENLTDNRSLPELLKDLPLSYPSLRQHFMRVMGHNIGEYQIQCRMEEAVNMLMRGVSVKETAFNLGYKDQFFFSKQFHQKLGYPPSAINPLNPRGMRRYQPKDVPATESAQMGRTPQPSAVATMTGAKASAPAQKTRKTGSPAKKASSAKNGR
jgi:AraC-like DNA-binding protein